MGERLVALREAAGETQDEVGDAAGVNSGTVSRWERDKGTPHAKQLVALAKHFHTTTDHILLGRPNEAQVTSPEFHRFLASEAGRIAKERGWINTLLTMSYPKPPTAKTYKAIVQALLMDDDE